MKKEAKTKTSKTSKTSSGPTRHELALLIEAQKKQMEEQNVLIQDLKVKSEAAAANVEQSDAFGLSKYGVSNWRRYQRGDGQVLHRTYYVDIRKIIGTGAR